MEEKVRAEFRVIKEKFEQSKMEYSKIIEKKIEELKAKVFKELEKTLS